MCCLKKAIISLKEVAQRKLCKMYSKEERATFQRAFWTAYGKYMMPVPNSTGEKVNWVNYKSGVRNIFFKLRFDRSRAQVAIELTHADRTARLEIYERFLRLKHLFEAVVGVGWQWCKETFTDDRELSSISISVENVNVFNRDDWPTVISFLKQEMLLLDRFWQEVKPMFED